MLVRLLPDDIEKRWPVIKKAILEDLPSNVRDYVLKNEDSINKILFALLDGTLHCWIVVEHNKEKEPLILSIITTTFIIEVISGVKNLLIYSVTSYQELSNEIVVSSYKSLREFARSKGCFKIISFTDNPENMKMAEMMGGKATQTLIEMEV